MKKILNSRKITVDITVVMTNYSCVNTDANRLLYRLQEVSKLLSTVGLQHVFFFIQYYFRMF